jgi:choline dehydrogenase-like flavoprotein
LFVPVSAPPTECPTFVGALGYESDVLTMSVNPARDAAGGFLLGLMRSSVAGRVSLDGDTVVVERKMGEDPLVRAGMLRAVSRLNEMFPGAAMPSTGDEHALLSRIGEGMWHGVGTMQMGVGGDSVTDGNGLVRGTANVWCMDAAVFPVVPPVPTQGPTMVAASILAAGFVNSLTT